jgi:hypothetical protein
VVGGVNTLINKQKSRDGHLLEPIIREAESGENSPALMFQIWPLRREDIPHDLF